MSGQVRSVTVRLSAQAAGYVAGAKQVEGANAGIEQSLTRLERKSASTETAMRKIGGAGKYLGLAAAAGIFVAEKKAADFNAEMANVQSLSHATGSELASLGQAARSAGTDFGYGAKDVASAEAELVKAGVSTKAILGGGLRGTLALAAAGQIDVADATQIAASAMTQFSLKGKDVPHVADLLAAGADKALGSVGDLGYGLSQVGTVANQFGYSIEGTVGTLAEFAQAGLVGEKGGTTLKQVLLQLASPTKQAQALMSKYNLSLYDGQGKIKSYAELADNLQTSFSGLDEKTRNQALAVIFGSHAIQGANILYKDGAKVNRDWKKSVDDQGFAAQQASGKLDSLKGDLKKLNAEFENVAIGQAGKQGPLRDLVQDVTGLLKKYDQLSDKQKSLFGKGVVGAAATGGALYVASKIYSLAKDSAAVYRGLFGTKAVAKAVGGDLVGKGISRASGVVPVYVTNEGFGGKPGGVGGGVGGGVAAGSTASAGLLAGAIGLPVAGALAQPFAVKYSQDHNLPRNTALNGGKGAALPLHSITTDLNVSPKTAKSYQDTYDALKKISGVKVDKGGTLFGLQTDSEKVDTYGKALGKVDDRFFELAQKHPKQTFKELKAAIGSSNVDVEQFEKLLPRTTAAFGGLKNKIGGSHDLTQLLGAPFDAAKGPVVGFAQAIGAIPGAKKTQLDVQDRASGPIAAVLAGTDKLGRKHPKPKVTVSTGQSIPLLAQVANLLSGLHSKSIDVTVHRNTTGGNGGNLPGVPHADGGRITGPGGPRDDQIPAYLSNGEYVISAAAVKRYGVGTFDRLNTQRFASGGSVSFVPGKDAADQAADDLQIQQQIRDLNNQLTEKVKKGKHKGQLVLRPGSLDQQAVKAQLVAAQLSLVELRGQAAADTAQDAADALQSAADALKDAQASTVSSLQSTDLFSRGSSPDAVGRSVDQLVADVESYGQVAFQLRNAGAGPGVLKLIRDEAEQKGDFKGAIKLGKALLASPLKLSSLNQSFSNLDTVTSSVAGFTTDPAFLTGGALASAGGPISIDRSVEVNLLGDYTAPMAELRQAINHDVSAQMGEGFRF